MKSEQEEPSGCDSFCQHPYCWHSLPQSHGLNNNKKQQQQPSKSSDTIQDSLPTMKVWNINDDYGLNLEDKKIALSENKSSKHLSKEFVSESPLSDELSPNIDKKPLKNVEVQEIFDWEDLKKDWQDTFLISQYYVWCPSRKSLRKSHHNLFTQLKHKSTTSDHLIKVPLNLKDVTEDMFPPKLKGKIPYQNTEEIYSIKQQRHYSSPQYLKHRIQTPSFNKMDKRRLRMLNPGRKHDISSPVSQPTQNIKGKLHSEVLQKSGILKNSKISLVSGKDNQANSSSLPAKSIYFMDEQMFNELKTLNGTNNTQINIVRETSSNEKLSQSVVGKKKDSQKKMASISMSNLPPLDMSEKNIHSFNYKLNPLLNVKLGPIAVPPAPVSKRISPPNSGKVSTLHVTVPSIGSPDRSEATPMLPYNGVKQLPEGDLLKLSESEANRIINLEGEMAEISLSTFSSDLPERLHHTVRLDPLLNEGTFGSWNYGESSPSSTTGEKTFAEFHSNSSNKQLNPDEIKQEVTVSHHHSSNLPSDSPLNKGLFPQVIQPNSTPICSPTKESMVPQISEKSVLPDISQSPVETPAPSISTPNELWPTVDENQYFAAEAKNKNRTLKAEEAYSSQRVSIQNVEELPAPPPPSPEGKQETFNFEIPAKKISESSLIVVQESKEESYEETDNK